MLETDAKRLRWWGIDMRPRFRRRLAVVGTYFVLLLLVAPAISGGWTDRDEWNLLWIVGSTMLWVYLSVFKSGGVVKSFEDPPPTKMGIRGMVFVNGLDEWAQYRFGAASFEEASEEQQEELLRRYRVGTYAVPAKLNPWIGLDEREVGERDSVSRWALQRVGFILATSAGMLSVAHRPLPQIEAGGLIWSFALLAMTLPQARVLWMERDPRDSSGEMELVAQ